jgi:hypothetical protein
MEPLLDLQKLHTISVLQEKGRLRGAPKRHIMGVSCAVHNSGEQQTRALEDYFGLEGNRRLLQIAQSSQTYTAQTQPNPRCPAAASSPVSLSES